jgi:hypothetical protein
VLTHRTTAGIEYGCVEGKKIWTHIGAVWPNKSGQGLNLTWDYLPLGDGLTVMPRMIRKVVRLHRPRYNPEYRAHCHENSQRHVVYCYGQSERHWYCYCRN